MNISLAVATGCSGSAVPKYSSKFTLAFSGLLVSFFSGFSAVAQNHIPERNPHHQKPPNSQALSTFDSPLSCCFLSAMHNFS
ncbi:hypothetical protein J6T66_06290 [bacterium]|nr:hypothetical protein [bacterium]